METKELLYGLIGFFLGGLLVAIAATTFNNDELQKDHSTDVTTSAEVRELESRHSDTRAVRVSF